MISLRPYQQKLVSDIYDCIRKGKRKVIGQLATGGGKTRVGSYLAHAEVNFGGTVLWIASREELVTQAYRTLDDGNNRVAVIMANPPLGAVVNPHRPIQVASLQTLQARNITPPASMVIVDETKHLTDSNSWGTILDPYDASVIIGFDATPVNGTGAALKKFEAMVHGPSVKELIALGVLVEPEIIYPGRQLAPKTIAQKPLDAWRDHANAKRAMVFAQNAVAAKEYTADFKAAGISCEFVSYETPNRDLIMDRFKAGQIQVIVNQNLFVEGFDDTSLDCIILARRCGSDEIFVQICGRVLRSSPGKTRALVVDLTGNVFAFGSPVDERIYTLGGTSVIKPGGKPDFRFCITCGAVLTQPLGSICPDCAALGVTAAQMQAPTITGDKLRRFAGINKRNEVDRKKHYFSMLRDLENKGKDIRGAYYKYKAIYTKPDGSAEEPPYKWITEYRVSPDRYAK